MAKHAGSSTGWLVAALSLLSMTAHAQDNAKSRPPASKPAAGKLGSSWDDVKKMPDFFTSMWQSVSFMTDGNVDVTYTDKAKQYIANYKRPRDTPGLSEKNCKTPGMPIVMRSSVVLKYLYEPGLIAVYMELSGQTRFIHMNRDKQISTNPKYFGNSIGHFEGDTLVIETVGFVDDILLQYGAMKNNSPAPAGNFARPTYPVYGPHGPNLRMVERMRLVEPNRMEVKLTVYDDTIFTKPYEAEPHYYVRLPDVVPREWVCTLAVEAYDPSRGEHVVLDPEEALRQLHEMKEVGK